jgi:catechol 2,3-dioxygenase-like lactoylglutathione lyase family enzyme
MINPNLMILYVKDPAISATFYKRLLGREPVETFPTYHAFALEGGFMLGLWSTQTVNPAPSESGNRTELAFTVANSATVETLYGDWRKQGVTIAQEPTTAVFGRTFVALDPDGHRLRVCTPDK